MFAATPKIALRTALAITVACGLVLSGCSGNEKQTSRIDPKALQAPAMNPQVVDGRAVVPGRSPEGNVGKGTGSAYQVKNFSQPPAALPTRQEEPEAPGLFDWAWKKPVEGAKNVIVSDGDTAPSARSVPANPAGNDSAPRKRPALNSQGANANDVFLAPATYAAVEAGHVEVQEVPVSEAEVFASNAPSAPVEQFASANHDFAHDSGTVAAPVAVAQAPLAPAYSEPAYTEQAPAPIVHAQQEVIQQEVLQQETFVPAEPTEMAAIPASNDYPVLSSVPPRPERLNAVEERDAKFVELENEYESSVAARQEQSAQVAHDTSVDAGVNTAQAETSLAKDGYSGIQSYGEEIAIVEEQVQAPAAVAVPAQETQVASLAEPAEGESYAWQSTSARRSTGVVSEQPQAASAPVAEAAPVQQFEEIPVVAEQSEAVVVEEYVPQAAPEAAPAPVAAQVAAPVVAPEAAPVHIAEPVAAPAPIVSPQAAPQTEVAAVESSEWVSVDETPAQTPVAVESAEVAVVPQTDSVALAPEANVVLTAPNVYGEKTVRVLPESRYSSRRQAVYTQQYARRSAVDSAN